MRRDEWLSILELKRDIKKQSWKNEGILKPNHIDKIIKYVDKVFKNY